MLRFCPKCGHGYLEVMQAKPYPCGNIWNCPKCEFTSHLFFRPIRDPQHAFVIMELENRCGNNTVHIYENRYAMHPPFEFIVISSKPFYGSSILCKEESHNHICGPTKHEILVHDKWHDYTPILLP